MWSKLLSAALLCGTLSSIVNAQSTTAIVTSTSGQFSPTLPAGAGQSTPGGAGQFPTDEPGKITNEPGVMGDSASPATSVQPTATPSTTHPTSALTSASGGIAEPKKTSSKSNNTGAIAGGVVGGVLLLALVGAGLFFLRRRKQRRLQDSFGVLEKSADPASGAHYDAPSPISQVPVPPVAQHHPMAPSEAHALMSHYGDTQPQQMPQEVQPVIMPKPYNVNSSRETDDDGISITSPSPVTTPSPERQEKRSVPRLPIYQGGNDEGSAPAF